MLDLYYSVLCHKMKKVGLRVRYPKTGIYVDFLCKKLEVMTAIGAGRYFNLVNSGQKIQMVYEGSNLVSKDNSETRSINVDLTDLDDQRFVHMLSAVEGTGIICFDKLNGSFYEYEKFIKKFIRHFGSMMFSNTGKSFYFQKCVVGCEGIDRPVYGKLRLTVTFTGFTVNKDILSFLIDMPDWTGMNKYCEGLCGSGVPKVFYRKKIKGATQRKDWSVLPLLDNPYREESNADFEEMSRRLYKYIGSYGFPDMLLSGVYRLVNVDERQSKVCYSFDIDCSSIMNKPALVEEKSGVVTSRPFINGQRHPLDRKRV